MGGRGGGSEEGRSVEGECGGGGGGVFFLPERYSHNL